MKKKIFSVLILVLLYACTPTVTPTPTSTPGNTPISSSTFAPTRTNTPVPSASFTASPGNTPSLVPGSFTFASTGDGQDEAANFPNTTNAIAALHPDLVIFNGDLEQDGVRSSEMNEMVAGLKTAGIFDLTFLVRGNHDDEQSGSAGLWEAYFSATPNIKVLPAGVSNFVAINSSSTYLTYSFDFGNSRFIGVDSPGDADLITSAEYTFMDQRLTDAESHELVHAFIFFHGGEYCTTSLHCDCTAKTDGSCTPTAFINLINKHPIVSATFHGHEHILAWIHMDNTRVPGLTHSYEEFFTSPSGGGSYNQYLYPNRVDYYYPDMPDSYDTGFGFVTVSGNSFTVSFYKAGTSAAVWTKTFTK
jgi:hypothetical protein